MKTKGCNMLAVLLFVSPMLHAQKTIEAWYDVNWVETNNQHARYYSLQTNTDSGWYRKDIYVSTRQWQMIGLYEDKESKIRNGVFRFFYADGKLKSVGRYEHNQKKGVFLEFYSDGSLKDSSFYDNGKLQGLSSGWYRNGNPEYTFTVDANGNGVYTSWFDNGQPSSAGRYIAYNQPQGRWQYFHKNGKVSAVELYESGTIKQSQYFNESGVPADDTGKISRRLQFPGGDKAWSKFISANIYFPSTLEFANGYWAVAVVSGTVNEDGKMIDVEVELPLHPQLDKIAMDALKHSPVWLPAMDHNRKISTRVTQTISFSRDYIFE